MSAATKTPLNYRKYPPRTCRSLCECRICGQRISYGQRYYDGGYSRRAHEGCA